MPALLGLVHMLCHFATTLIPAVAVRLASGSSEPRRWPPGALTLVIRFGRLRLAARIALVVVLATNPATAEGPSIVRGHAGGPRVETPRRLTHAELDAGHEMIRNTTKNMKSPTEQAGVVHFVEDILGPDHEFARELRTLVESQPQARDRLKKYDEDPQGAAAVKATRRGVGRLQATAQAKSMTVDPMEQPAYGAEPPPNVSLSTPRIRATAPTSLAARPALVNPVAQSAPVTASFPFAGRPSEPPLGRPREDPSRSVELTRTEPRAESEPLNSLSRIVEEVRRRPEVREAVQRAGKGAASIGREAP